MKVCRLKIDTKGRVQLPKSFLDANNIKVGQTGYVEIISNNTDSGSSPLIFACVFGGLHTPKRKPPFFRENRVTIEDSTL